MTNLAAIPMPVRNVRPVRTKRGRTILLTPQEMLEAQGRAKTLDPR
jgi:hypothetical protein